MEGRGMARQPEEYERREDLRELKDALHRRIRRPVQMRTTSGQLKRRRETMGMLREIRAAAA